MTMKQIAKILEKLSEISQTHTFLVNSGVIRINGVKLRKVNHPFSSSFSMYYFELNNKPISPQFNETMLTDVKTIHTNQQTVLEFLGYEKVWFIVVLDEQLFENTFDDVL